MASGPLSQILQSTLYRLDLGQTLEESLITLATPELSSAQHLGLILAKNQAFEHFLKKSDAVQKRKSALMAEEEVKDAPKTQENAAVKIAAFLGKNATRNSIVCMRLMRVIGTGLPRTDTDTVTFDIQKLLKRALEIEDFSVDHRLAHGESNFAGGLLYDWLAALLENQPSPPKAVLTYMDELWKEAFRTAQIAYHVGSTLKTFKYQLYAFSGGLVLNTGRILMAMQHAANPSWLDFVETCKKARLTESHPAFVSRERKAFPYTHNEFSAMIVSFFPPLSLIEKSICFYQEPYLLRRAHPDLFRLAVIFSVAQKLSALSFDARRLAQTPSLILTPHQLRWLKEIGIPEATVLQALKAVKEPGK